MGDDSWLRDFHAGDPAVLDALYRRSFETVVRNVGRYLVGSDAETVTHEVFYRLLTNENLRRNFEGGDISNWLARVASNAALDTLRRRKLESGILRASEDENVQASCEDDVEAKLAIDRFRRERLPPQWAAVFDARFLRQLPQRDAAKELGMRRTTLVYQEQKIRELLRDFLFDGETP